MNKSHLRHLALIGLLSSGLIVTAVLEGCPQNSNSKALPSVSDAVAQIFKRRCVGCHSGQDAPKGLDLRRDKLMQTAINIPSAEKADVLRIKPGEPDNSYLMWKVRHDSKIVGKPMPPAGSQLSDNDIRTLDDWIVQLRQ